MRRVVFGLFGVVLLNACEPGVARLDDPYPDWEWDGGLDGQDSGLIDAGARVDGGVVDAGVVAALDAGGRTDDAGVALDDGGIVVADAGVIIDAGVVIDAGVMIDAGAVIDAGAIIDAGGAIDAGRPDAGAPDAGRPDSGAPDAGRPDAGTPDAGRPDSGILDAGPSSSRQAPRPLGSTDAGNGFYEYLPPGYPGTTTWPLLVFWHGIGENGNGTNELGRVLGHGPPRLINQNQWPPSRPFVVLSPQHSGGGCPSSTEIQRFFAWAMRTYAIDSREVYLTGLSCGAIGSFSYLTNNLDTQVAAAVLIAGDPGQPTNGGSLWGRHGCDAGVVAMWSFHGSADGVVSPNNNRDTFARLGGCPQPPRRDVAYVEFPGVGHDSWTEVYNLSAGHDIYTWLLAHPKP